tara:strand:- start:3692 stop:5956 length:2265 start_codon:yes stop_codon:yes gene_type:complete
MPNYTINTITTLEEPGDVVSGGTLPSSNALVITPDPGFALDATGFSATLPLPTGVLSVAFTNSTSAFAAGNVVNVAVSYTSGLTMPSADLNISINICESGGVIAIPNVNTNVILGVWYGIDNRLSDSHTQTIAGSHVTYNAGLSSTTVTNVNALPTSTLNALTGSGYANTITSERKYYDIAAAPGSTVDVFSGVIDVSAEAALYINPNPDYLVRQYLPFLAQLPPRFELKIDNLITTGSGGVDKIEYTITYTGAYTQAELDNSGWTGNGPPQVLISLEYEILAVIASTFVVTHLLDTGGGNYITTAPPYGLVTPPGIATAGETRTISFVGTIGAQFTAEIYSNDGSSGLVSPANLDVTTGNVTIVNPVAGTSQGSYDLTYTFPLLPSSQAAANYALRVIANSAQNTLLFTSAFPNNIPDPSNPNIYTWSYTQFQGTPNIRILPNSSSGFAFTSIAPQNQHTGQPRGYQYPKNQKKFQVDFNITKTDGSNVAVTKQPEWPDDFTNTDPATNGGTVYGINGIQLTGSGTSTVRFRADGIRDTVGQSDVTFGLDLDSFMDVSGSTTAVSSISLDTFPVASASFNLTDGINVNSTILPGNATNTDLTWTVTDPEGNASGFTITPASDTQSAVVNSQTTPGPRTVTATANNGVTGTITVTAVQPTLETVGDSISVYAGRATIIDITSNDTTLGGGCTVSIEQDVTVGSLAVSGQTVTYTAPDVQTQQITFTYKLTKSGFVTSNISTVTIQIVNTEGGGE